MIERKKMLAVVTLVIILVCSIVMIRMFQMPKPKTTELTYKLGTTIPTNASVYFDNVAENVTVSVNEAQFKTEGLRHVDVSLHGITYKVLHRIEKPKINDVVAIRPNRATIVKGENYFNFFKIPADLHDNVTFSKPSEQLTEDDKTVTITAFDQTVTQQITVLPETSVQGKLTLETNFNDTLQNVVTAYLTKQKVQPEKIAMVYYNFATKEAVRMNETTITLASEAVYVPIAMIGEQKIKSDSTQTDTIKQLIDSMIVQESALSYRTIMNSLGGEQKIYQQLSDFGHVNGNVATVTQVSGQTTASYFEQVLQQLYAHQDVYPRTIAALKKASQNRFISRYLGDTVVWHRPSAIGQIINDVAIVEGNQPYALVLFTRDITGGQFVELAYLIHEWHNRR